MRFTLPVRQIATNQTIEALKKSISKTIAEATPHIQAAKANQVKILSQKFSQFNDWYVKITGLDKVNLAQEKVNALQDQLLEIQAKRRDVSRQLTTIREKSMELQDEIHKIKRQDDLEKYLELMKKETEVLKLEKSISKTFQDYDQTERELFTAFTDSIRDSHEKQRAQMEYTKYFGIILSITGSFLAFVYTTLRKQQLKEIISESLQTVHVPANSGFALQLLESNKKLSEEIATNRKEFDKFSSQIKQEVSKLLNRPITYTNTIPLPIMQPRESSNFEDGSLMGIIHDTPNAVKIGAIILGLWVISRVLFN
ncbi:uncharacterized protein LOC126749116 [Anthonomus grandis grandis]|uniref:uncharacterized protein LOC126749116 n=1 Tax=Anthonomus grandis grandis TaxID=2921223 RepID=UPI0021654EC0|nr:uncharacterized protein LOC126749116 [Anthonomus grandis grandis]